MLSVWLFFVPSVSFCFNGLHQDFEQEQTKGTERENQRKKLLTSMSCLELNETGFDEFSLRESGTLETCPTRSLGLMSLQHALCLAFLCSLCFLLFQLSSFRPETRTESSISGCVPRRGTIRFGLLRRKLARRILSRSVCRQTA